MKSITLSAAVVSLLLLAGCGGTDNNPDTVDAEGVITLDGKPVVGAAIVCIPANPGISGAQALSGEGGSFALAAFEGKGGAEPGSYTVQVTRTVEIKGQAPAAKELGEDAEHLSEKEKQGVHWKNDLPKKYSLATTSGIVIDVPESGTTDLKIELSSE